MRSLSLPQKKGSGTVSKSKTDHLCPVNCNKLTKNIKIIQISAELQLFWVHFMQPIGGSKVKGMICFYYLETMTSNMTKPIGCFHTWFLRNTKDQKVFFELIRIKQPNYFFGYMEFSYFSGIKTEISNYPKVVFGFVKKVVIWMIKWTVI